jgi:PAS domain S-box-containing protein
MTSPEAYHFGELSGRETGMSSSRRGRLWVSLVIAISGVVLSFLFFRLLQRQEQQLVEAQFRYDAEKRVEAVQAALNDRLNTLGTLATCFAGSELVERREFETFVGPLLAKHSGIQALGWAPRIQAAQRQAHEQFVHGQGLPKYEIVDWNNRGKAVPAGMRGEYFPILFLKPADKNQSSFGLDIQASSKYRAAVGRAKTSQQPVASTYTQAEEDTPAKTLLLLVARAKNDVSDLKNRPADQPGVDGFVFGLFQVGTIVELALGPFVPVGIDVSVVAPSMIGGEQCVYTRLSPLHAHEAPAAAAEPPGDLHFSREIEVADSRWRVECVPIASYCARYRTWGPLSVLMAGLLITGLLVGYFSLLIGSTAQVERLAAEKSRKLQEGERKFSAILDQTYQFIGLMRPDGILIEANRSALEFSGIAVADVRNKPFWETPWWSHSPELQQRLRTAVEKAAQGEFVRMEATHIGVDGELRWVDFSLKPVRDENGKVILLIPEGRDITVRKQIEEALHKEQHLLRSLLDLHEQDRKLTAYEIHDGLAQQLAGALYKFQSIDQIRDSDAAREMFEESVALLREAMAETRRLISGLRPPILDESGAIDAIEYMISERSSRGGPNIEFIHAESFPRLAPPLESAVFRIVQECLTNACRYSQSENVRVEVRAADDRVHIEVRDWGIGFDLGGVQGGHYGLQGIRERARLLGGAATIETAPAKGTCVSVYLPLLPPLDDGPRRDKIPPRMDAE